MIDYYVKLCITEVSMNGNKLKVGKFRDRHAFWIDGDDSWCTNSGDVKSHVIIIQNEAVAVSACHGKSLTFEGVSVVVLNLGRFS